MSFEDCRDDSTVYEDTIEAEFERVMQNDVAVRVGFNTATTFGLDEIGRLKAAIISSSNAHANTLLHFQNSLANDQQNL